MSRFSFELYASDPDCNLRVREMLASVCTDLYAHYFSAFTANLTSEQQDVYSTLSKIPYDSCDWWRDIHDLIVPLYMQLIVAACPGIPAWMVTAAIVHDRGYAVRAHSMKSRRSHVDPSIPGVAHWESIDSRTQHAIFSRVVIELLSSRNSDREGGSELHVVTANVMQQHGIEKSCTFSVPQDSWSTFLTVIEQHDYPLIGRYRETGELTRHHFDADSLYSISVTSFLKDWLFYQTDPSKVARIHAVLGIQSPHLSLKSLLLYRLARYYPSTKSLPEGWNSEEFPVVSALVNLSESRECIQPHSVEALRCTAESFRRLARVSAEVGAANSIDECLTIVRILAEDEFGFLLRRN